MNERQNASATIAKTAEAAAERLLQAILDGVPVDLRERWEILRRGISRDGIAVLRDLVIRAYDAGYDDGFAEGSAEDDEPGYNEGYE